MTFDVWWNIVKPDAMEVMRAHVLSAPHTEVGGFMIGEHGERNEPPKITAAIEARAARGDLTHLRFTHEVWEQLHEVMDEEHPDQSVIGWYHSHPGHGIFLSGYDQFIQRNFFSAAWQVAIVIDPVNKTEGLFAWAHNDIVLLSEREIGGHAFAPTTAAAKSVFRDRSPASPSPRSRLVVTLDDVDDALASDKGPPRPERTASVAPPRRHRIEIAPEPVGVAQGAAEPYPWAGHLIPVGAGLLFGGLLALLSSI